MAVRHALHGIKTPGAGNVLWRVASLRWVFGIAMYYEIWKDVVGYGGAYQVSSYGRVRSMTRQVKQREGATRIQRGRIMRQCQNRSRGGYHIVNLRRDGAPRTCYVHRLVCEAFHGSCPDGMEASHADDIRSHNYPGNLSWQTHAENIRLRAENGGDTHGESNGCSKLTDTCVHIILAMCSSGKYTHQSIAEMFGVQREAVSKIAQGIRWKNITRPMGMSGGPRGHKKKATEKYWQKVEKALDSL